jgi:hypothetical protein
MGRAAPGAAGDRPVTYLVVGFYVLLGVALLVLDYRRRTWLPAWRCYAAGPWLVLTGVLQGLDVPSWVLFATSLIGLVVFWSNSRTVAKAIGAEMDRVFQTHDPKQLAAFVRRLKGEGQL